MGNLDSQLLNTHKMNYFIIFVIKAMDLFNMV